MDAIRGNFLLFLVHGESIAQVSTAALEESPTEFMGFSDFYWDLETQWISPNKAVHAPAQVHGLPLEEQYTCFLIHQNSL